MLSNVFSGVCTRRVYILRRYWTSRPLANIDGDLLCWSQEGDSNFVYVMAGSFTVLLVFYLFTTTATIPQLFFEATRTQSDGVDIRWPMPYVQVWQVLQFLYIIFLMVVALNNPSLGFIMAALIAVVMFLWHYIYPWAARRYLSDINVSALPSPTSLSFSPFPACLLHSSIRTRSEHAVSLTWEYSDIGDHF